MKKFIKQMLIFLNQEEKNSIEYEKFKNENKSFVSSFNDIVHEKELDSNIEKFQFSSLNSYIRKYSKKHRAYEFSCPFYKNNDLIGLANILIIMEPTIKAFEKIYENNCRIIAIYFDKGEIGCIYENKKGTLDYFIEKTLIEMITVKDVTVDISLIN